MQVPVPDIPSSTYTVAVRALCEFTARQGDLDLRFTPAPSALEGIQGHGVVRARRAHDYQSEIALSGQYRQLTVRGRADGYDPTRNQLEEIKTHRSPLDRMPDNHRALHWAQARTYGWLMCEKLGLQQIRLALVYFDIVSEKETVLIELHSADGLRDWFEQQCQRFLHWAEQEMAHRKARDLALTSLAFPYAGFRTGQRQLAENVYKAAAAGRCLMAQAPTGIGKTIGTLFPLLKAMPGKQLDKVFCLSAKTSGRRLALDALDLLANGPDGSAPEEPDASATQAAPGESGVAGRPRHPLQTLRRLQPLQPLLPLRVLELIARDKACEHPDKACHGDSCPLAKGFYDRLPAARRDAAVALRMDQSGLRQIALAHQICPYYLSQEMARWTDVVVGDYNYYFDLNAMLYAMTLAGDWRVAVLVDEAHNMIERGRKMFSAELDQRDFGAMRRSSPAPVRKSLDAVSRRWNELVRDQHSSYQAYASLPEKFLLALQKSVSAIADYLSENPAEVHAELQRFYFDAMHFNRVAELFDSNFLFDITLRPGSASTDVSTSTDTSARRRGASTLSLRNLIPAPFLKQRFAAAHCSVLFSATLSPWHFYGDTLGMPEECAWVDIPPSFQPQQLSVHVVSDVSTRYQHREDSLDPIAAIIARQFERAPGNYLAFFSSFDYLQKALAHFRDRYPAIPVWEQARQMSETAREQFLARFSSEGSGVGFAVLGGVFGEGVDLPGKRLIGAFIATLGLPQLNPVNETIRQRMEQRFGAGYDYTYFFPGLQKVVQAAGRVIRSEDDTGVLYLIDDRFARADARALYPQWWRLQIARADIQEST